MAWPNVTDGKFDTLKIKYLDEKKDYRVEIFFCGVAP
jgi:hypothetical protein